MILGLRQRGCRVDAGWQFFRIRLKITVSSATFDLSGEVIEASIHTS
jgi:hypothetical protein